MGPDDWHRWLPGVLLWQLVEKDHIEQRLIHLDAAVVTDKPELAKAIHKKSDVRPCGADHLRQRFLRDGGDEGVPFSRLAKFGHQKENPRQALFAGIEELIDEIGLGAHTAGQQKFEKEVGEGSFVVHHADHLIPPNLERRALA